MNIDSVVKIKIKYIEQVSRTGREVQEEQQISTFYFPALA